MRGTFAVIALASSLVLPIGLVTAQPAGQPKAAAGTPSAPTASAPAAGGAQNPATSPTQSLLGLSTGRDGAPVAVEADQGIEWEQQKQLYIARGNAKAVRGDVTIYGQVLQAYYRKTASGGSDIWRLEANDRVKITTSNDTALGDKAVYDVDNAIFVLTGKKLELDTPKAKITARDSLEYWQQKQYAVARGNAEAVREDKTLRANVLMAHFKQDQKGATQMSNVEAFQDVLITTPNATARALYGDYNLESGIAILKGQVKITRGADQLNGECAEVNLNTGISRLFSCSSQDRVRGLLVPTQKDIQNQQPKAPSGKTGNGAAKKR